ncbi:MAG: anthranilate phosphoribosyltransferase [Pyrinomonadaceae bacterium]
MSTDWLLDSPKHSVSKKADTRLFPFLSHLTRGENLSFKDSASFFRELTSREALAEQIAGSLVALVSKGETFEELAGMAKVMNEQATKITTHHRNYIDIAGTGSSNAKVFNISSAASFVIAGAGLAVAKNTSRAVTSHSGSAEVLNQLGVKVAGEPKLAQACLNGAGLCFMFAPKFHPTLLRVGDVKRGLGIRTSLNLLGVLSNPSNAPMQLLGVWHPSLLEPMAQALSLLGITKAWVVHGEDGLDEITLAGKTRVAEVSGNKIRTFEISPVDFGFDKTSIEKLRIRSPKESAQIISDVLASKRRDEARSLIVMNSAAALVIGGITDDPLHAARLAEQSIDSGSARIKLDRLIQTTNKK